MSSRAVAPTMVPGYRHSPGDHCGSTALRNLLSFAGVEISEAMAFGLGAGPCFYYLAFDGSEPSRWIAGRAARLEENFLELTGTALSLRTEENPGVAWEAARETVDSGAPVLLLTDLFHLDHYGRSAHFPGHAVVLAGYDDEVAYLSDTAFAELQTTSLESLALARHGDHPAYPLRGHAFTVGQAPERAALVAAIRPAIERAVREMLEPQWGEFAGVPALRKLVAEVADWPEVTDDWKWCARFSYQVIERRGTGGGNFRLMYSRFLDEAGDAESADLAKSAATGWTELATDFHSASEADEPDPGMWKRIGERARICLEAEERLWHQLA